MALIDAMIGVLGIVLCPVSARSFASAAGRAGTSRALPMDQAIVDCFAWYTTGRPAPRPAMQVTGRDLAADLSSRIVRRQTGMISHRTRGRK